MPIRSLQALPTPVAVKVQGPGQAVSLEGLQASASQLSEQLGALRAQRDVLRRQVNGMPANEVRAGLEVQRAQLDGQIAQVDMQLAAARAQIASRLGVPQSNVSTTGSVTIPPPFYQRRTPDPDMIVGLSFTLAIAVGLPIAIAYARRIWRGRPKETPAMPDESASRLERLEHAVDAIAIEIERVAEGQRFVTKVFAERPVAAPPVSPLSTSAERHDAALGDAKPFLALGAGPIEPIRVAERQVVKQSITPH